MRTAVTDSDATDSLMRTELTKQLAVINQKIDGLLDLAGDPEWPRDRLTAKMTERREKRTRSNGSSPRSPDPTWTRDTPR